MRLLSLAILTFATIFPIEFALAESLRVAYDKCASAPKGKADLSEKGILKTCLHRAGLYSAGCDLVSDDESYSMSCDVDQAKAIFGTKVEGCIFQVSNQLDQYNKSRFYLTRNSAPNSPVCRYDGYTLHADARIDLTNVKRKSDSSWDMPDIVFPILLRDKFNRSNVVIREIKPVADVAMSWDSDGTFENPVYTKKPACTVPTIDELVQNFRKRGSREWETTPEDKKKLLKKVEEKLGTFSLQKNRLPQRAIIGNEPETGAHFPTEIEISSGTTNICGKAVPTGHLLKFETSGTECDVIPTGFLYVLGIPISAKAEKPVNWHSARTFYACKPKVDPTIDYTSSFIRKIGNGADVKFEIKKINFETCDCSEREIPEQAN